MASQKKGTASDPLQDVRSQLGSLVLSNGSTINANLQRTTPPSLASSHYRPTSPPAPQTGATPPSITPGSLNFEQLKQLVGQKPQMQGSHSAGGGGKGEKSGTSPTTMDPITSLMQQLQSQQQKQQSHESGPTRSPPPQPSPKLRPTTVPASMVPPPKSEQARIAREAAKAQPTTSAASPKTVARQGKEEAKADAQPSQRRPVLAAPASTGKADSGHSTAQTSHGSASASAGKPSTTTTTTTTTVPSTNTSVAGEVAMARAACAFISKAFGDKILIDNIDAPKPIIRTAPTLPAGGRYIVVGDVHGCVGPLEALIEKVKYVKGTDCLIIIGDYVNKGPDSVGVVRACMKHEAIGVLGNHDYTLLNCLSRMHRRAFTSDELRDPVKRLAQEFPRECECYLRALPHAIRIPAYNVLLVHAGVNIQCSLEQQDVRDVMHVRRLEEVVTHSVAHHKEKVVKYNSVYKGDAGVPWAELWKGPEHIIFGHDAFAGFQSHPFACGIDTGCVYGDALTCVVFSRESPKGDYFDVPGLPKHSNERLGLPPPDSDIYEQSDFERQLIRPTTRATPATMGSTPGTVTRPNFLAMPMPMLAESGKHSSTHSGTQSAGPTAFSSPASLVHFASPATVAERNAATRDSVSFGAREVQCGSLLALATAGELAAIAVLLCVPSYDAGLEQLLEQSGKEPTTQQAFWRPFVSQVLGAVARRDATAGRLNQLETDTLDYVFGICDDLPIVCEEVKAQLAAVQKRSDVISLGSQKYAASLIHDN